MPSDYEYKPKFSFEISEELKHRSDNLFTVHGIKRALFEIILTDVLDLIEENGEIVIGFILANKCKPREVLPSLQRKD